MEKSPASVWTASAQAPKKCLIFGISGQDGAYLANHLLSAGMEIVGTSRTASSPHPNLERLRLPDEVPILDCSMRNLGEMVELIGAVQPDAIFNLAGQTSVARSFDDPAETRASIALAVEVILDAISRVDGRIRFYNSSSSEMFGETPRSGADERTAFSPVSPYGVAKVLAHETVRRHRDERGLFACSGIVFNHESPLRGEQFVSRKIINAAARIARGDQERLQLGDVDVWRDWGWGPEYVEAIMAMTFAEDPSDYVIATGTASPLLRFVELAFSQHGLDWRDHVTTDASLARPAEIRFSRGDPSRLEAELGWRAQVDLEGIVDRLSSPLSDA